MALLQRFLNARPETPTKLVAPRFLEAFAAHGIERTRIPRWIPSISYDALQNDAKLLPTLTPQVLDATAQLFGLEVTWLEGTSDLAYIHQGERNNPKALLDRIAAAVHASGAFDDAAALAPLRIVTATESLDPSTPLQQPLALVIVQAIGSQDGGHVYRCQVHSYPFDWSQSEQRLELKAIAWLVHHRLQSPVPLHRVEPEALDNILAGCQIPSVVLKRSIITNPSLEDYVQESISSRVAKETDELPEVLQLLETLGLLDYQFKGPERCSVEPAQVSDPLSLPGPEPTPPPQPPAAGKRQAQQAIWEAIINAAQSLWTESPNATIAEMVERLKRMPHLKANSLSDSAIHKHIRAVAPPNVRGKPGRKPNQSA